MRCTARNAGWPAGCSKATTMRGDEFDLTQDFVSEMIGVRRNTVSQLAHTRQQEGLIKYRRGRVTIVDRAGLEARCCECYGLLAQSRYGIQS